MPVQIGASVHTFSDPVGFLSDCHRRIEMFLASLEAVGNVIDQPVTSEASQALEKALRYFRESAPKHNADEEESLFPRMRRVHSAEIQPAVEKLDALEKEHRWAEPLHEAIERIGRRFLAEERLQAREVEEFRRAVSALTRMYREHIRVEEEVVFPAAAEALADKDQAAIGNEMAARRKAPIPSG